MNDKRNRRDDSWAMDLTDLEEVHRPPTEEEVHRPPTEQDIQDVNRIMADYRRWEARRRLALIVFVIINLAAVVVTAAWFLLG